MNKQREPNRTIIGQGQWLQLQSIQYQDPKGQIRQWELATRIRGKVAVAIIARIMPLRLIVLVRQFRPPIQDTVIEFPAGLMDENETPEAAAVREFYEETGYYLQVDRIYPPVFNSPGLTDESAWIVVGHVNAQAYLNKSPVPSPEPAEFIETILIPEAQLVSKLNEWICQGQKIDAKVMSFILGIRWQEVGF